MRRSSIAGLQLRSLNRGRMPFGIQPGFEAPPPHTCQYIAGQPTPDDSCKCDRPVLPGSSYCPEHHARCWRREDEEEAVVQDAEIEKAYRLMMRDLRR